MSLNDTPGSEAIRRARFENPKLRERDLALQLGISEAELIAAYCGYGVRRIAPDPNRLISGLGALGEVMALTRNDSAVHEKIGVYDNPFPGERAAMVLSSQIDLRIFPGAWKHGFAVEKDDGNGVRRSLQFFDASGAAVHKVHLRPASNVTAYERLVDTLLVEDQSPRVALEPVQAIASKNASSSDAEALRQGWSAMRDVHEFHGLLRHHGVGRRQAVGMVGETFAWRLDKTCLPDFFAQVVNEAIAIMCFVGNRGCIQIHSGPIVNVKEMGPWLNVTDPTFHLHLRADHVAEMFAVRKPTKDGHVTSLELYDTDGKMIIQFFGKRKEGEDERTDWRRLAENLPRDTAASVA